MEFELSAKSGNAYTVQKKDNIMNNKKASGSQIDVALITTNRAGTLIRLTMTQKPETDSPLLVCSKIESTEDSSVTLEDVYKRQLKWKDENIVIEIKKIKDNQDKKENYVAYWKDNTAFYEISGKMEKEEFLKMIKNIRF